MNPSPTLGDVGAEVTGGFSDLLGFFVTYVVPGVFLLVLAVIGVRQGIKWLKTIGKG